MDMPLEDAYKYIRRNCSCIILGDDSLWVVPDSMAFDKEVMATVYSQIGFNAKVKYHRDVHNAEFCSSVFLPAVVDGVPSHVMAPKIGRFCSKFGFTMSPDTKNPTGQLRGNALGVLACLRSHPVLGPLILQTLKITSKGKLRDDPDRFWLWRTPVNVVYDPLSLVYIYQRYGIDENWLDAWRRHIQSWTSVVSVSETSLLDQAFRVDC
jgi:hypothetical protein